MSIDRPDVKVRLDHEKHGALKVFAKLDGCTITEYCERVINENLSKRIGDTNLAYAELGNLGIVGFRRDSSGNR